MKEVFYFRIELNFHRTLGWPLLGTIIEVSLFFLGRVERFYMLEFLVVKQRAY